MSHKIIRTVYHFKDDKGWTHEEIVEGEVCPNKLYFITKRKNLIDTPELLSYDPPSMQITYYEFDLVNEVYEHFSLNYYIKHLFYEMK